MIAGKAYIGPLADLWSCGVVLFALVCGYLPFEDSNTAQLYQKILSGLHGFYIKNKNSQICNFILDI